MSTDERSNTSRVIPFRSPRGTSRNELLEAQQADVTGSGISFADNGPGVPDVPVHCWTSLILENYLNLCAEDARDSRRLLRAANRERFTLSMARYVCSTVLGLAGLGLLFEAMRHGVWFVVLLAVLTAGIMAGTLLNHGLPIQSEPEDIALPQPASGLVARVKDLLRCS